MSKVTSKTALYHLVRYAYVNTDSEAIRGSMEASLVRHLQERRQRRERRELRELISAFKHARYHYANNPSELVVQVTETAIPRLYRQLQERGVDPSCMLD